MDRRTAVEYLIGISKIEVPFMQVSEPLYFVPFNHAIL
jgi:hypothetical protein